MKQHVWRRKIHGIVIFCSNSRIRLRIVDSSRDLDCKIKMNEYRLDASASLNRIFVHFKNCYRVHNFRILLFTSHPRFGYTYAIVFALSFVSFLYPDKPLKKITETSTELIVFRVSPQYLFALAYQRRKEYLPRVLLLYSFTGPRGTLSRTRVVVFPTYFPMVHSFLYFRY